MENVDTSVRPGSLSWTQRIVPIFTTLLVMKILDNFMHIAPFFNFGLALPVGFLPLYWLFPTRKISFVKYVGLLLGFALAVLVVLCLIPELLSQVIPRDWVYGLSCFAVMQGIFWLPKRLGKQSISTSICLSWFLISALVALLASILIRSYDFVR